MFCAALMTTRGGSRRQSLDLLDGLDLDFLHFRKGAGAGGSGGRRNSSGSFDASDLFFDDAFSADVGGPGDAMAARYFAQSLDPTLQGPSGGGSGSSSAQGGGMHRYDPFGAHQGHGHGGGPGAVYGGPMGGAGPGVFLDGMGDFGGLGMGAAGGMGGSGHHDPHDYDMVAASLNGFNPSSAEQLFYGAGGGNDMFYMRERTNSLAGFFMDAHGGPGLLGDALGGGGGGSSSSGGGSSGGAGAPSRQPPRPSSGQSKSMHQVQHQPQQPQSAPHSASYLMQYMGSEVAGHHHQQPQAPSFAHLGVPQFTSSHPGGAILHTSPSFAVAMGLTAAGGFGPGSAGLMYQTGDAGRMFGGSEFLFILKLVSSLKMYVPISRVGGLNIPHSGGSGDGRGFVGAYSPEARRRRIERFLEKRKRRVWTKKVKYDVRKNFADSRLRVKGRFVKKEDEEILREIVNIE
jgi:hypothetical protein